MIVPMKKVFVAARESDHERLLEALGHLGVVHLVPVDADRAVADEDTLAAIDHADRAIQVLSGYDPIDTGEAVDAADAVNTVLRLEHQSIEGRARLHILHQQIGELDLWGDVQLDQIDTLEAGGVQLQFALLPTEAVGEAQAELVCPIGEPNRKKQLVAIVSRGDPVELPEQATLVERPQCDRPSLKAEAADIDAMLAANNKQLAAMTHLIEPIRSHRQALAASADAMVASRSATGGSGVTALQGWAPAEKAASLHDDLAAKGLDAAIEMTDPAEDESPPTLIRYPLLVRPIKALFDILGTLPGYRELDLSPFFMLAFPLFAAMLIGDAGYGLLFIAAGLCFAKKLTAAGKGASVALLVFIGVVTFAWGILTGNVFGITPDAFKSAGGIWEPFGSALATIAPLYRSDEGAAREILMKASFIVALIHLPLARLRSSVALFPDSRFLGEAGWATVLVGMFGLVWHLLFIGIENPMNPAIPVLIGVGVLLAIVFTSPSRNIAKRLGIGLASSLLPFLGTFSDTMSYIRLMAVGLASFYIGSSFNMLGAQVAESATWLAGAPIVLAGHALNIGLALIAVFAHGVRLNMLEFSSNAGVQWAGFPYEPFGSRQT